jgi:hypothetical protein
VADTPPSFWTTLPGILTGVAALITALVAAATLYLSSTRRRALGYARRRRRARAGHPGSG